MKGSQVYKSPMNNLDQYWDGLTEQQRWKLVVVAFKDYTLTVPVAIEKLAWRHLNEQWKTRLARVDWLRELRIQ